MKKKKKTLLHTYHEYMAPQYLHLILINDMYVLSLISNYSCRHLNSTSCLKKLCSMKKRLTARGEEFLGCVNQGVQVSCYINIVQAI